MATLWCSGFMQQYPVEITRGTNHTKPDDTASGQAQTKQRIELKTHITTGI